MTIAQTYLIGGIYLVVLIVVAVVTRPTWRRLAGAVAGGVIGVLAACGIIPLGELMGWWHMVIPWKSHYLAILLFGCVPCGFIFLITWRIARRFGRRGLAVFLAFVAVIGPPRDYWWMRQFPEWGHYGPGIAPILAVSAGYVIMVLVGHAVMSLVAGPSRGDPLAPRSKAISHP